MESRETESDQEAPARGLISNVEVIRTDNNNRRALLMRRAADEMPLLIVSPAGGGQREARARGDFHEQFLIKSSIIKDKQPGGRDI